MFKYLNHSELDCLNINLTKIIEMKKFQLFIKTKNFNDLRTLKYSFNDFKNLIDTLLDNSKYFLIKACPELYSIINDYNFKFFNYKINSSRESLLKTIVEENNTDLLFLVIINILDNTFIKDLIDFSTNSIYKNMNIYQRSEFSSYLYAFNKLIEQVCKISNRTLEIVETANFNIERDFNEPLLNWYNSCFDLDLDIDCPDIAEAVLNSQPNIYIFYIKNITIDTYVLDYLFDEMNCNIDNEFIFGVDTLDSGLILYIEDTLYENQYNPKLILLILFILLDDNFFNEYSKVFNH